MLKTTDQTNGRLQTAVLLSLCLMSLLTSLEFSGTQSYAPVPGRKPVREITHGQFGNFMDFSKALPFLIKSPGGYEQVSYDRVPSSDVGLYKEIFVLQANGSLKEADAYIARLQDRSLMGHVLYQRYTHPSYKTSFAELKDWLDKYSAEPGAGRIYKMANARVPKGYTGTLKKPRDPDMLVAGPDTLVVPGKSYESARVRSAAEKAHVRATKDTIINLVRSERMEQALKRLAADAPGHLDTVEYDQLRAHAAAAYMYRGNMDRAYELAVASAHRSGQYVPLAGWVAGMTAWSNGRYAESAKFFEITARSQYSSGWLSAAGSFWAARAYTRLGDNGDASYWLDKATRHPRTFYGLIATKALNRGFDFNWHVPTFTKKYYDVLMATPEGRRAIALVAAGQPHRAESELMAINPRDNDMRVAILAYAGYADLPALAMRLGNAMLDSDDSSTIYDAALYPRTPWQPGQGYMVDPSLINAIARQESRFDPAAKSASGALGLMQLMPATASSLADETDGPAAEQEYRLKDPEMNLELGQRYILSLLKDRSVNGDILKLLVAYNAGPGNLAHWEKQWESIDDPLMFIELIPSAQTRTYVERVISNYWIYSLREGEASPTLEALAAGKPALYAAADYSGAFSVASR